MARVVGVPGMAQEQKTRPALYKLWLPSLRGGVEGAAGRNAAMPTFDLAFYGDVFLSEDAQGKPVAKSAASATDQVELESVSDDELRFLNEVVDEVTLGATGVPKAVPPVPQLLQPIARSLTRRFNGSLVLGFIATLRQVRLYLEDEEIAGRIRAIVAGAINNKTATTRVLLAHSLGTVVALAAW